MSLCTPAMTVIFWIVILLTAIAGFWLVWKKHDIEKKHDAWLASAEESLKEHHRKNDLETKLIRTEYEKARKDYLEVMKEMKSDEIPDPESYYPKR